jgi:hypothetical protein
MARRRGTRKNGLVSRLAAPFRHLFQATGESAALVGTRAGKIAKLGIGAGEGVLGSFAKHTNMAVRNLTRRRGGRRASRRSRSSRRSRRA